MQAGGVGRSSLFLAGGPAPGWWCKPSPTPAAGHPAAQGGGTGSPSRDASLPGGGREDHSRHPGSCGHHGPLAGPGRDMGPERTGLAIPASPEGPPVQGTVWFPASVTWFSREKGREALFGSQSKSFHSFTAGMSLDSGSPWSRTEREQADGYRAGVSREDSGGGSEA